ncbi:hypothetical protein [Mesorhizobium sp. BR1-1-14]|uniref:hypothetical protein n=1 Tax=Mesorhizobium sp. BR1-1-14 TaxID=2876655 RepID=UPI0013AEDEE8|nr:hypothetical protein [Mesorhizobium sp. BR1-1-14]MBZ9959024.1 hypothetical protein [Mesorhizobium sp. BR1-1-14]
MDIGELRAGGALCSAAGSLVLAWRVSQLVGALGAAVKLHDVNFRQLGSQGDIVLAQGASKWVEGAQGTKLLVTGFLLLALGGVLQAIGFWFGAAH